MHSCHQRCPEMIDMQEYLNVWVTLIVSGPEVKTADIMYVKQSFN